MEPHALPLGFGMALAQNEPAMKKFEAMSEEKKREIVESTHNVKSKAEMRALVESLNKTRQQTF